MAKDARPMLLCAEFFTAASIGFVAFLLIAGLKILSPTNIAWLELGDPASHYMGWTFFRASDWTFPLGLNPKFGGELGSSIVYSDSNALLALLFKSVESLLPDPFQYFGLWILICFVMQSIIGWKIIDLVTEDFVLKALGTCFFVFSPPMIWRLYGHFNLFAHFLLLGALLLVVSPPARGKEKYWIVTLVLALATHAYLFAMVFCMWAAHIAGDCMMRLRPLKQSIVYCMTCTAILVLTAWQVGYFSVRNGVGAVGAYGVYKANLLTFFDAENWSYFLADIPTHAAEIEGFAFLGTGVILLLPFALYHLVTRRTLLLKQLNLHFHWVLTATFCVMFTFALSRKIGIGNHNVELAFLKPLEHIGNTFRASGRMIWPIYYAVLIFILATMIVCTPRNVAALLLGVAILVQIIDTSAAWPKIKQRLVQRERSEWATTMRSPFWKILANRYDKVHVYPPENQHENWREIAYFAAKHNLQTNAVYLARVDSLKLEEQERKFISYMSSGKYPADTFFIVNDPVFRYALKQSDPSKHLVAQVNGYFVLAPNWDNGSTSPPPPDPVMDDVVQVSVGEKIVPNTKATNDRYLIGGWSGPEPKGTWTDGRHSLILLPVSNRARQIVLDLLPFVTPKHPKQTVKIAVNGEWVKSVDLDVDTFHLVDLDIAKYIQNENDGDFTYLLIELMLLDAVRPKDAGLSQQGEVLKLLGICRRCILRGDSSSTGFSL